MMVVVGASPAEWLMRESIIRLVSSVTVMRELRDSYPSSSEGTFYIGRLRPQEVAYGVPGSGRIAR
jgi:hypothetical protein